MSDVKITVLMPAYNAAKYIAEAIDSVLAQTFTDFELLILDDGSTDNTIQEIKKFSDPRIRLIECEHKGIAETLNYGLNKARGYFIARFDADDICYADRLMIQYDFMQANPDYVLLGAEADYMDMDGEYVFTLKYRGYSDVEIRSLGPAICPFSHVTVMYKKDEVINAGGYDNNAITFEDHLLWSKLVNRGKVCNLARSLVRVRFNPESVTIDEKWRGKSFNKLKYACLRKAVVTTEEGDRLRQIIKKQDLDKIKKGAYYSLIAKKYLWDNYHPAKARKNLGKLMNYYPAKPGPYFLYLISFLPRNMISLLYRSRPKRS
jgi:glycosyltransferase involved in cell wall biosynthesis